MTKRHTSTHRIVCWQITLSCNRRCPHCISHSVQAEKHPERDIEKSIKRLVELGIKKISYSGGEPLRYPHIASAIEIANNYNLEQIITTNGDHLNFPLPQWIKYLKYIKLSFYGHAYLHDTIMGHGSYRKLMDIAQKLNGAGITVGANYVLSYKSKMDITYFLEDAYRHGIKQVLMIVYVSVGIDFIDKNMKINDIDNCILKVQKDALTISKCFTGGVKIFLYNDNDFSLLLDSNDNFIFPRSHGDKPFVMGNLFDNHFKLPDGRLIPAAEAVDYYLDKRISTPNIILIG